MPELPEVETIARQLAPHLEGRMVRAVEILDYRLDNSANDSLPGRRIISVRRLGKQILMELAGNGNSAEPLWLCFHLRMTGRLIVDGWEACQRERHLRARLHLDRGCLYFFDSRRFGLMRVIRSAGEALPNGIDPLTPEFTVAALGSLLKGKKGEIKPWLMRQDRLAGIGNIYASEILFDCRLDPRRAPGSLKPGEIRRLHDSTVRILNLAIEHCGTTFSDFQDSRGENGSFQKFLTVYARECLACRACGLPVEKIVQQQRSTFFCPRCQK